MRQPNRSIRTLRRLLKKILKSTGSIVSGTAAAILQIQESLDQRSWWLKITSDLSIYFIQSMKKNQTGQGHREDISVKARIGNGMKYLIKVLLSFFYGRLRSE